MYIKHRHTVELGKSLCVFALCYFNGDSRFLLRHACKSLKDGGGSDM